MIRLARVGARKQPHYRVVVIEKDRARNGRSVEVVGTYNPRTNPASVLLKRDRIEYWTVRGAQISETVAKLLRNYPTPAELEAASAAAAAAPPPPAAVAEPIAEPIAGPLAAPAAEPETEAVAAPAA